MLTPEEKKRFESAMMVNKVIWAAMFVSVFIYVALVHIAEDQLHGTANIGDILSILTYALMGVSLVTAGLIRFVRGLILAVPFKVSQFGQSSGMVSSANTNIAGRYATALIVSLALAESISIYGLVLFLMGASFEMFYIFVGASAFFMLVYRPKMSEIEALAEAVKQHERTTTVVSSKAAV